jgi:hypothetical protein
MPFKLKLTTALKLSREHNSGVSPDGLQLKVHHQEVEGVSGLTVLAG